MSKRRGQGEGSVFREGAGWVAVVEVPSVTSGRRVRRKRRARTKREALDRLRELQSAVEAGVVPGRLTVGGQLSAWLIRQEASGKSANTIENYRWAIEKHLLPAFGTVALSQFAPEHLEELMGAMRDGGAAKNTIMRVRSVLRMAMDDAVARRRLSWNPVTPTQVPRSRETRSRSLTVDQVRDFLHVIARDRLEALWLAMLLVGLRPGEAAGLSWDAVDLDRGLLQVEQARIEEPEGMRLGPTKTKRSVRTVELPARVVTALGSHRACQNVERERAGGMWREGGLVFTTSVGTPLDRWAIRRRFVKVAEAAGLGTWQPRELRHTFVSICSDGGVRLEDLADTVGHATTRMTGDVYRHQVRPAVGAQAKAVIEELFPAG